MLQLKKFIPKHLVYYPKSTDSQIPHCTYIVEIIYNDNLLYKVGISQDVHSRIRSFTSVNKGSSDVYGKGIVLGKTKLIAIANFPCKEPALIYEKYLKDTYKEYKYLGKPILANGNTELFTVDILKFITGNACSS